MFKRHLQVIRDTRGRVVTFNRINRNILHRKHWNFLYSLLTETTPETLEASFCNKVGLTALKAPAAAFVTALNIMAGQVR